MTGSCLPISHDERYLTIEVGDDDQEIHLTNHQKQHLSFTCKEDNVASTIIVDTSIGRMVLDASVTLSLKAYNQIDHLDYSFFRYGIKSPINVVFPPLTNRIGLHITSNDHGETWIIDELVLFDT